MFEFILLTVAMNGLILAGLCLCRRIIPIRAPVLFIATGISSFFCALYPFMASFLTYPAVIYFYVLLVIFGGVLLLFIERFYFPPRMAAGEQLIDMPDGGELAVAEAVKAGEPLFNYEQPDSPCLLFETGAAQVTIDQENCPPETLFSKSCLPLNVQDNDPVANLRPGCDDLLEGVNQNVDEVAQMSAATSEADREDSGIDRYEEAVLERTFREIAASDLPAEDNLEDNKEENSEDNSGPAEDGSGAAEDIAIQVDSPGAVDDIAIHVEDSPDPVEHAFGPMEDIIGSEEDEAGPVKMDTAGEQEVNDPSGPVEDYGIEGNPEKKIMCPESPGDFVAAAAGENVADYRQQSDIKELIDIAFSKKNIGDLPGAVSVFMHALKLDPQPGLAMLICIEMSSIYRDIGQRTQAVGVLEMLLARWGGGFGEKVVEQVKSVIDELKGESK